MNKVAVRVVALVAVIVVVVVVVLLRPWGRPTEVAGGAKEIRLVLVPKSVGHPYWEGVREGMEAAADDLRRGGRKVQAVFHGAPEATVDKQLKIIEDFISQGYDGIGISPNDPTAVKEVIRRAMDKGIAVVTFDSDSPDSRRLMYIGTDNRQAGRVAGQEMIKLLGAKPKSAGGGEELLVQIIGGQPGAWNLNERIEGFREAVKDANIKLCDMLFNEESPDKSLQVAENSINAHPGLRGFFCSNAFGGPGTALAIKGAIQRDKIKPGQVRVVAFDTTEDILNYVEDGVIDCTLAQQTRLMGRLTVERLVEFADQRQKEGKFAAPPKGKEIIDTGVAVVRKDDVPKYRTRPGPAAKPTAAKSQPAATQPAATQPAGR